jgi:dTDP-4-amino-4,6-dideoxygalactose transaminase
MRLDECQAAFLAVKLKYLNEWLEQRREIASWYRESLSGIESLILPVIASGATHTYHLYVVRTTKRDALQKHLEDCGIGTLIHYPVPPHLQRAYKHLGYKKGSFPLAEQISDTVLSLPIWPGMTENNVAYVAESCKKFFK